MEALRNILSDKELITEIRQRWHPAAPRAGRLVRHFDGIWRYSIALSDTDAIAWSPSQPARMCHLGCLQIHPLSHKHRDSVKVAHISKEEIFANLIASVPAFHLKWKYSFQGWNCERWARLVVSSQPISQQVKENEFGSFNMLGTLHRRCEAIAQTE